MLQEDRTRLLEFMNAALEATIGIEVQALSNGEAEKLRQAFSKLRSEFDQYRILMFSVRDNKVHLIKKVHESPDV